MRPLPFMILAVLLMSSAYAQEWEVITPNDYDSIITSKYGVVYYDVIDKAAGSKNYHWQGRDASGNNHGLIMICDDSSVNCDREVVPETWQYWWFSQDPATVNIGREPSVWEWLSSQDPTKREFWVSFEDLNLGDRDFNDVLLRVKKGKDKIRFELVNSASGYKNPTNILFDFDADKWFVFYRIRKHVKLLNGSWDDGIIEDYRFFGDLSYNLFYDDSAEGQWIEFEFEKAPLAGDPAHAPEFSAAGMVIMILVLAGAYGVHRKYLKR